MVCVCVVGVGCGGGLPAPHDLVLKSKVVWIKNWNLMCTFSGAFQQGWSSNTKRIQ